MFYIFMYNHAMFEYLTNFASKEMCNIRNTVEILNDWSQVYKQMCVNRHKCISVDSK